MFVHYLARLIFAVSRKYFWMTNSNIHVRYNLSRGYVCHMNSQPVSPFCRDFPGTSRTNSRTRACLSACWCTWSTKISALRDISGPASSPSSMLSAGRERAARKLATEKVRP